MKAVYKWWATLVFVAIVVQIGLAGYGAFYAAHKLEDDGSSITDKTIDDGFGIHIGFGYLVWLAVMVLLVIGVIAGVGRWRLGKHGVLALLLTLQILLAWFGGSIPAIGAFHPLNAFVILALTLSIVWDGWQARKARSAVVAPAT